MAEAFGAVCELQPGERTTHVVAAARGTEKTLWAAQHGRMVVTPAWLVTDTHTHTVISIFLSSCV